MKKIPTLFERDWAGDRTRLLNQIHPGCEWVLAGEGIATRKIDGTCCLIRDDVLYRRRELRKGEAAPAGFELAVFDAETGKSMGWLPVGDGPEDRWHRAAFHDQPDGTYELMGPKIQGNPDKLPEHVLIPHSQDALAFPGDPPPRSFDGLRDWLAGRDIEGIVFHHPDGRRAKIKLRDFGLKRPAQ